MAKFKKKAKHKGVPLKIDWEYVKVEDAEERILKALEMILRDKEKGG